MMRLRAFDCFENSDAFGQSIDRATVLTPIFGGASLASGLHIHDFLVGGDELVAHLHPHLEADVGLLQVHHHVIERDAGFTKLERFGLPIGFVLCFADARQRLLKRV